MPTILEDGFTKELWDAFHEAKKKYKFKASRFVQMMTDHGGVDTARRLLGTGPSNVQSGLTELWRYNRLDLSIEAKVLIPKYRTLFTDDLREIARQRLESRHYYSKPPIAVKQQKSKSHPSTLTLSRGRVVKKPLARF